MKAERSDRGLRSEFPFAVARDPTKWVLSHSKRRLPNCQATVKTGSSFLINVSGRWALNRNST